MAKKNDSGAPQVEVLERFDPDGDGVTDADPGFEFMLDPETVPADAHFVWVKTSDNPSFDDTLDYKGKRYRPVTWDDGVRLMSGREFSAGETMQQKDMVLMARDLGYHKARTEREHKQNREIRKKMLRREHLQGDTFLPSSGNRPMVRR
jgi:hypothetical protein